MTGKGNKSLPAALIIIVFLLSSCNDRVVFSEVKNMKSHTWNLMDRAAFNAEINDTLTGNNLFFSIRSGSDYPFRNIFLFVSATSPDGKTISDTLEYFLADEKGRSLGKGFGDLRELDLPFKTNVYFPLKGSYRFTVQHGMRMQELKGIYDIGMRIEKIR